MDSKLGNLKLYDEIVGTVVANVLAESARTDNKIYLKWFESDQASHNVYFEGASIAAAVLKTQIYMDMPLHKYILFKFKNWRRRKLLKWVRTKKSTRVCNSNSTNYKSYLNPFRANSRNRRNLERYKLSLLYEKERSNR